MNNSERVTVSAILDRYQAECLPELAPRTQKDYVRHLDKLRQTFGHLIADELKPRDFGPFLQVKKGKISRVRQLAVLSSAFTQAVSFWYVMERNVLRDVKRPKSKPRHRLIKQHEFDGVMAIALPTVRLAMKLALKIGQRQGDLLSLKWEDIKPGEEHDEIHIYQSKTGKRMAIEIDEELERILDECWQLPYGGHAGGEYVITRSKRRGGRYTSEGFRATWQRTMKQWMRGGGENFHFHDIRALCATKCPTPEFAMRLLGHTTIGMTMRVYRRGIERVHALPST